MRIFPIPSGAAVALLALLGLAPGAGSAIAVGGEPVPAVEGAPPPLAGPAVERALARRQRVPVLVALRPAGVPSANRTGRRRTVVADAQSRVLRRLPPGSFEVTARWQLTPGFAGTVTRDGLRGLLRAPEVARVDVDRRVRAALSESVSLVRAPEVHAAGLTGAGVTVGVVDTGVDTDHPDLASDLVAEQCFARHEDGAGACPNGQSVQSGPGAAEDDEGHGTAVAGIITSDGVVAPKGVAPGAKIVAVKVLASDGSGTTADIVSALDWLLTNRPDVRIVNLSLGVSNVHAGACDDASAATIMQASVIRALRSRGVTVFVASGNDAATAAVGEPACIESAISVGGVYDGDVGPVRFRACSDPVTAADRVLCVSNAGPQLDLLAPGGRITTSARGGSSSPSFGTSNAAPHAAGVAALMLQARPDLSTAQVETTMKATGVPVVDARSGVTFPRVSAAAAAAAVPALPVDPRRPYLPSSSAVFADAAGDATAGPDVGQVTLASSADGLLTVAVDLPNRPALEGGETVWVQFDLDRDSTTGGRGAEIALVSRADGTTDLARWTGSSWRAIRALAATRSGTTLAFRVSEDEIGVLADFSLRVYAQTAVAVSDVSPDNGEWPFPAVPLVVERIGTGAGTVSGGAGASAIACGAACGAPFARSASVTLTASAAAGSVFVGWDGQCAGVATCTVTMADAATVRARFEALRRVSVATGGTGAGAVASEPGGIACGSACAASFAHGTALTLTAVAEPGSSFSGWTGSCAGGDPCTLPVDGDKELTAVFADVAPPRASVSKAKGRRGRLVRLQYRMRDNAPRVRLEVDVLRGRKTVARIRREVAAGGAKASVSWRIPKRFEGSARFCVRGRDAAGNVGNRTCAPIRVTR